MTKSRIIWAAFGLFVIFVFSLMVNGVFTNKRLRKQGMLTTAVVTDYKFGYRGGISFIYEFVFEGKLIKNKKSFMEIVPSKGANFLNKAFPVLYLQNSPSNNQILISRYSFKEFEIPFPDSLNWVIEFEK